MIYIHPTSTVETSNIGDGTYIGPYCYVSNRVIIGKNCKFVGFSSIGVPGEHPHSPEDQMGMVEIENDVEIREFVNINAPLFGAKTKVGSHSYLMSNAHVAHDCILGDHSILSAGVVFAGHVVVGKHCNFGINCAIHQRSEIGDFCMIGAGAFFKGNSPEGIVWAGVPAVPIKINIIGLDRHATLNEKESVIKSATKYLVSQGHTVYNGIVYEGL